MAPGVFRVINQEANKHLVLVYQSRTCHNRTVFGLFSGIRLVLASSWLQARLLAFVRRGYPWSCRLPRRHCRAVSAAAAANAAANAAMVGVGVGFGEWAFIEKPCAVKEVKQC